VEQANSKPQNNHLVEVKNLKKSFPIKKGLFEKNLALNAVNDISFFINKNETLGLVGESGCGKSTTGRLLVHLLRPTSGQILFKGSDLNKMNERQIRYLRNEMQFIFQDPYASLDPRRTILSAIGEPLEVFKRIKSRSEKKDRVAEVLTSVGLNPDAMYKYPFEFSGGQRQRICIARALALGPDFIVADEPVSALDVSIQAQIINLLSDMKEKYKLTYLFISHDLSVVEYICDRIVVMYLGKILEIADKRDLFDDPKHPYTIVLQDAVPRIGREMKENNVNGEVPSPLNPPKGCVFHPRCPHATRQCAEVEPELKNIGGSRSVACFLYN
jgi:oligopeptide transport system ATP-binding protein